MTENTEHKDQIRQNFQEWYAKMARLYKLGYIGYKRLTSEMFAFPIIEERRKDTIEEVIIGLFHEKYPEIWKDIYSQSINPPKDK